MPYDLICKEKLAPINQGFSFMNYLHIIFKEPALYNKFFRCHF